MREVNSWKIREFEMLLIRKFDDSTVGEIEYAKILIFENVKFRRIGEFRIGTDTRMNQLYE